MNHRYREGGGGLGFGRGKRAPAREYKVETIGGEVQSHKPVENMSLGEIAQELSTLQAKKDAGRYLPPAQFARFCKLKLVYNKLSEG